MTDPNFSKCECRHCAGPIEFPVAAAGETVTCPHCGQAMVLPGGIAKVPTKARTLPGLGSLFIWGMVVVATVILIMIKQYRLKPAPEKTPETPAVAAVQPAVKAPEAAGTNTLVISSFNLESEKGSSLVYVTGSIHNTTDRQRFGVKVDFSLLDTNGTSTGVASDYVASVDPRGVWKFKALVIGGKKATTARLNSISEAK